MATQTQESPEASEIRRRGRRRLIGAIALVLAAVVFVPMLLDSEPRKRDAGPSAVIPAKEGAAPLPAPPAPAKAAAEPAKVLAAETKVVVPVPPKTPAPAQEQPKESPRLQGFAVQVGAFRDEAKLKQAREKLVTAGVVHYTERLEAKAGPLTRLRAGPFATRAEAEAALKKLKGASIDGKVVPLP